jgi:tetrahydromethanopterin S-methyltransferase subunit B
VSYDHQISGSTDDLAAQLERIFDDEPADPAPESTDGGDVTADGESAEGVSELVREMDLLRDQLEEAFAEVVEKVDQLGRRLVALQGSNDTHTAEVDRLAERSDSTLALVQDLVATLDAAVAASREPWEPDPVAVDLAPIAERLGHLDEAVAATYRELVRMHDAPLAVDTSRLEDVASRGSLHNAADIANLRRDVEALTESARSQDKTLRDMRSTLEWIKDRLLR